MQTPLRKPQTNFSTAQIDRKIYCGIETEDLFQEWVSNLCDSNYYAGLNNIFRKIEFECGQSYDILWDDM